MQINITCPTCSHTYQVAQTMVGMKLKCRNCGGTMVVEMPEVAPPQHDEVSSLPPSAPAVLTDPGAPAEVESHPDQPVIFGASTEGPAHDVFHLGAASQHRRWAGYLSLAMALLMFIAA